MNRCTYRLATYSGAGTTARAGLVIGDRMFDVARVLPASGASGDGAPPVSVLEVLRHWREWHPRFREFALSSPAAAHREGSVALADVQLHAPILFPGVIFCAGANYRDHVQEMSRALNLPQEPDPHELGLKPWHFIKPSVSCVRGPGASISLPAYSSKVDWEAEIAVVIGQACRNVSIERALDYAAGLTIVNDLSARDHLKRQGVADGSPFRYDWVSQKAFEGSLPVGPWICPIDDIDDTGALGIRLWVNDELMQDSSSSNLIFTMAEQIAHLSTRLTLNPGDVIATGTPAGCGSARGRFLKPGDRVRVWVENIGELTHDFTN